ncbi:hypothetical protein L1277_000408 [Okibacterium sp. HSC-33S16]|uniref:hypothetical protein n=1 Tax=Okibacterium sp. HSC-33S16 TaxID=2910965 RepID=UPI0020A14CE2|nr:hypothetical protein [Okibacterium sp. HSC-33S16]MCP2030344.1 hypothetical protein [Okibacterium sp. HSC-33S16]
MSSSVPYVTDRVPGEAAHYLPHDPYEPLDVDRVKAFVDGTSDEPDVRLAVLGVLRAHSMNGAETPAAVFAIMVAALTMLASSMGALSAFGGAVGWALGISMIIGCVRFTTFAFAAHIRRMTCGVWLAAYEDSLR